MAATNADLGTLKEEFNLGENRYYLLVNPNAALGPPTWRISNPDEISHGPGGGGGGTSDIDFLAEPPIVVDKIRDITTNTTEVEHSMDITLLPDR